MCGFQNECFNTSMLKVQEFIGKPLTQIREVNTICTDPRSLAPITPPSRFVYIAFNLSLLLDSG